MQGIRKKMDDRSKYHIYVLKYNFEVDLYIYKK